MSNLRNQVNGLNKERFLALFAKLIGEAEFVQNNPPQGLVPEEDRVVRHIVEALEPYSVKSGGVLQIEQISYHPGRSNLMITYPSTDPAAKTIAFVGSHMDVVPATPETWERNPFELTIDGDKLYGRGTTDCLGHVALITEFLIQLCTLKPALKNHLVVVFIASEEAASIPADVGIEGLVKEGRLEHLKGGPIFWVDSADSQPCIGTAGAIQWHLKAIGKLFHSGLPHKGINSLELGMEAMAELQKRFYATFPALPQETTYRYTTSSTMKPTQMECAKGSLNQIPPHCTISGDVRLTPFYDNTAVVDALNSWVAELNEHLETLPTRGPFSKYILEDGTHGRLELSFGGVSLQGVACDLTSLGYKALVNATRVVRGSAEPFSICGSLPLVREMKDFGFDIQICGYGLMSVYHADNEYCLFSDMDKAIKIFAHAIDYLENPALM